jgi:hypothetical protein
VDLIHRIFRRPVHAIPNRTYGMIFDLIECVVQRCFSYSTQDTRFVYKKLGEYLDPKISPEISKLVVIAHSQGGIILSNVVDMLLADIPLENLRKMEIYTFGYAPVSILWLFTLTLI